MTAEQWCPEPPEPNHRAFGATVQVTPDPKPSSDGRKRRYRRYVAGPKQWAALRSEKLDGQPCRVCDGPAATLHHIVPRSQTGSDTADNLAPLCGHGTAGCHGLIEARDPDALAALAVSLTDGEYSYVIEKLGEGALERLFGVMSR